MDATDEQLERIFDLAMRFARMRERPVTDVVLALLNSDTLRRYGRVEPGRLTEVQADACICILQVWIEKAGEVA